MVNENEDGRSVQELFGNNLKRIRKENNLTQEELSEKVGITQKHLSIIETGKQFPSSALIEKLAAFFKVSVSTFFEANPHQNEFFKLYNDLCTFTNGKFEELYLILGNSQNEPQSKDKKKKSHAK